MSPEVAQARPLVQDVDLHLKSTLMLWSTFQQLTPIDSLGLVLVEYYLPLGNAEAARSQVAVLFTLRSLYHDYVKGARASDIILEGLRGKTNLFVDVGLA